MLFLVFLYTDILISNPSININISYLLLCRMLFLFIVVDMNNIENIIPKNDKADHVYIQNDGSLIKVFSFYSIFMLANINNNELSNLNIKWLILTTSKLKF